MLQISNIWTKRTTDRTKTRDIRDTWLVNHNTINRIGRETIFYLLKEPRTKILVIKAGHIMRAPMAVLHLGLRMTKGIPARHERRTRKQVAKTSQAHMYLQTSSLGQTESALQITGPARL